MHRTIPRLLLADGTSGTAPQAAPADIRAGRAPMMLTAAVGRLLAAEGGSKLRRFRMEAYNGGPMSFYWSDYPVVVDIAGLTGMDRSRPILKDHSEALIIGHSERITAGNTITIEGVVSGAGRVAQEVVEAADNGFPWQASIGVNIRRIEEIRANESVTVNGRSFNGPLLVVRVGDFKETSFVALGADDSTSAAVLAASNALNGQQKGSHMPPKMVAWLKAQGWTQADIDALKLESVQFKTLEASWKAQDPTATASPDGSVGGTPDGLPGAPTLTAFDDSRRLQAGETLRVAAIREVCAGKFPALEAKAISEGWTKDKTELEVLRASRPSAPAPIMGGDGPVGIRVLHAAAFQALGMETKGPDFDERTLQAAHSRYRGRIGLGELILEAAWANGFTGRTLRSDLRGALQAAFSSVEISGILSNVANKTLLTAFNSVEDTWRRVGRIASVRDFKAATRYRLTASGAYEKVGATGEIKHGKMGEETYANKAETWAQMFAITRQDIINDDLGALTAAPQMLGLGAARRLNLEFWREFLDNAAFFTTGNGNYASGAGTALSIDALTQGETLFLDQKDNDKHPLGITPRILLVPNALNVVASTLVRSTEVRDPSAKAPTSNPHTGKFTVERSSYLSDTRLTGNSTKAWYLLADPTELPAIEVAFLDGQQAPTIEQADADFSTLGIQMRGFHDFGVAKQDYRGGCKLKGEA